MRQSVGKCYVGCAFDFVVGLNLIQAVRSYFCGRGLTFHDQKGMVVAIKYAEVSSYFCTTLTDSTFYSDEAFRVFFLVA